MEYYAGQYVRTIARPLTILNKHLSPQTRGRIISASDTLGVPLYRVQFGEIVLPMREYEIEPTGERAT